MGLSRGKTAYIFPIILMALLVSYLPALKGYYAFSDSVKFWNKQPGAIEYAFGHIREMRIGRFLAAYILTGYGLLINSVNDLNIIRFISVLQLSICAFLCFLVIRKGFASTINAVFISIMLFTLPPFQVMASWAITALHPNALLLSCLSALLVLKIPIHLPFRDQLTNKYTFLSVFLSFCAHCIYPSAATFYWVMVCLIFLSYRTASLEAAKRRLMLHYGIGLSAIAVYALTLKIFCRGTDVPGIYNTNAVTVDYWGKLTWFIREPLYNSLNLWEIFPEPNFAAAVVIFIALTGSAFLFRALRRSEQKTDKRKIIFESFFYSAFFLSLILLSFLPNLVAAWNAPYYRCCAALTSMIVIILICALYRWVMILPKCAGKIIVTGVLFVCCFYGMHKASDNVLYYRVIPSSTELTYLKTYMNQAIAGKYEKIHINLPQWRFTKHRYDEFGGFNTNWDGVTYSMLTCVMRELARDAGLDLQGFTIYLDGGRAVYAFRRMEEKDPFYMYSFYLTVSRYHEKDFLNDRKTLNIDMTKLYDFI